MNESGIRPIEDRLLIKVKTTESETEGGILLPDSIRERREMQEMEALIIEIGPLVFSDYEEDEPIPLKVGDTLLMAKYSGLIYEGDDGDSYRIVGLKDIVGVKT